MRCGRCEVSLRVVDWNRRPPRFSAEEREALVLALEVLNEGDDPGLVVLRRMLESPSATVPPIDPEGVERIASIIRSEFETSDAAAVDHLSERLIRAYLGVKS